MKIRASFKFSSLYGMVLRLLRFEARGQRDRIPVWAELIIKVSSHKLSHHMLLVCVFYISACTWP